VALLEKPDLKPQSRTDGAQKPLARPAAGLSQAGSFSPLAASKGSLRDTTSSATSARRRSLPKASALSRMSACETLTSTWAAIMSCHSFAAPAHVGNLGTDLAESFRLEGSAPARTDDALAHRLGGSIALPLS
jgi:hypothetical protein